jgi:hypothetical protein
VLKSRVFVVLRIDNAIRAKFKEVSNHGGAARATLEPYEKWGLGKR